MQHALTPYDLKLREQAIERVRRGESCRAVALDLGISPETVRRWARSARIDSGRRRIVACG
jgi:transposase